MVVVGLSQQRRSVDFNPRIWWDATSERTPTRNQS